MVLNFFCSYLSFGWNNQSPDLGLGVQSVSVLGSFIKANQATKWAAPKQRAHCTSMIWKKQKEMHLPASFPSLAALAGESSVNSEWNSESLAAVENSEMVEFLGTQYTAATTWRSHCWDRCHEESLCMVYQYNISWGNRISIYSQNLQKNPSYHWPGNFSQFAKTALFPSGVIQHILFSSQISRCYKAW